MIQDAVTGALPDSALYTGALLAELLAEVPVPVARAIGVREGRREALFRRKDRDGREGGREALFRRKDREADVLMDNGVRIHPSFGGRARQDSTGEMEAAAEEGTGPRCESGHGMRTLGEKRTRRA